jgi:hypothetical protein
MSLAEDFIEFAERTYSIDWAAIQRAVAGRLRLTSSLDSSLRDPARYPAYWCVPVLVGSYVGASRHATLIDTEAFLGGCIMRHCMFEPDRPFDAAAGGDDFRAIAGAYDGCRVGDAEASTFDARFAAKCIPWKVLLGIGTRSIAGEAGERPDYETAMKAIVRVYSCVQVIDDWNDRDEDAARSHWNMWVDEPVRSTLSILEPLMRGSCGSVEGLRPHLLRRALGVQLEDTAVKLREPIHSA